MTRRGLEVRVGAVVVLAGIILVVGTMWFQKFQFVEKRYPIFVKFDQVGGLSSGDPIMVNGVERGRVNAIDLRAGYVVAELGIREDVAFPDDSDIRLKSIGIMGERFVAIKAGTSRRSVAEGDTLDGKFLAGLPEVMGGAGDVLEDVAAAARDLREVAEVLTAQGKLQETMDNLAAASEDMRKFAAEGGPKLSSALESFESASTSMDELLDKHYSSLDSSLAAFGRSGGRVEMTMANLDTVAANLMDITTMLRSGEGGLGRMIYDDTLVNRLEATITHLDSLILDIRRHPRRYLNLELF